MKRLICLFLCVVTLVCSVTVFADFKDEGTDYTDKVNIQISDARLYEKSIEAKLNGSLEWYPFPEGEFDAEYGDSFKLGISDNSDSFTYYYDVRRNYLIQYFNVDGVSGIIVWNEEVPVSYEEFN